jgi:hypothetical protein
MRRYCLHPQIWPRAPLGNNGLLSVLNFGDPRLCRLDGLAKEPPRVAYSTSVNCFRAGQLASHVALTVHGCCLLWLARASGEHHVARIPQSQWPRPDPPPSSPFLLFLLPPQRRWLGTHQRRPQTQPRAPAKSRPDPPPHRSLVAPSFTFSHRGGGSSACTKGRPPAPTQPGAPSQCPPPLLAAKPRPDYPRHQSFVSPSFSHRGGGSSAHTNKGACQRQRQHSRNPPPDAHHAQLTAKPRGTSSWFVRAPSRAPTTTHQLDWQYVLTGGEVPRSATQSSASVPEQAQLTWPTKPSSWQQTSS